MNPPYDFSDKQVFEEMCRCYDHLPVHVYIYDLAIRDNVFINKSTADFGGHNRENLKENYEELAKNQIHPDEVGILAKLGEFFVHNPDKEFTSFRRLRSKEGKWIWFLSTSKVLYFENGQPRQIIGTGVNVEDVQSFQKETKSLLQRIPEIQETLGLLDALSKKEREIAVLLIKGKTPSEIATKLGISKETLKSHRKSIIAKTGISSTAELGKLFYFF